MTEDRKKALRCAANVEPASQQEMRLARALTKLVTATGKINEHFIELTATGTTSGPYMERATVELMNAIGSVILPLYQLRYLMELPDVDILAKIAYDVDLAVDAKANALYTIGGQKRE